MVQLSVCIEMFWRDLPFEERIRRVARLGFPAFEFWGWEGKDLERIKAAASETGLAVAAIALEPGFSLLRRGYQAELVQGMKETARVARQLGCRTIIATTGNTYDDESYEITRRRVVRHGKALARIAEDNGLALAIEPLNTLVDHHGYWLTRMSQAVDIVEEIGSPAARILDDIYHQQITEGNIIPNLTAYIRHIAHFHTAGHPGRHELVGGELDYRAIFRAIDAAGYTGYVGLEYSPTMDADLSLQQALSLA
ncbi:MAG: TIM barrel protein [Anaerolineae bacterium]|nr:TIM barrel protein [Anaerolineae bacterium]